MCQKEHFTKFDDDMDLQQLSFIQDHLNREIDGKNENYLPVVCLSLISFRKALHNLTI